MIYGAPGRTIARGTKLNPPANSGGRTYTHAVVFEPDRGRNEPVKIGEWRVEAVNGNTIVVERGVQMGSWAIPGTGPGTGTTEVVYASATGGNCADSPERWRVYDAANPMARRGSLAAERLIPGDGIVVQKGDKRPLLEVLRADAYAQANPAGVNYNAVGSALTAYSSNEGTGLQVGSAHGFPGARVEFDDPAGALLAHDESFTDSLFLTRRIYDEDPEVMPVDMTLAANEFFWNPIDHSVRLGDGIYEGRDRLTLYYYLLVDPAAGAPAEKGDDIKLARGFEGIAGYAIPDGDADVSIELFGRGTVRFQRPFGRGVYVSLDGDGEPVDWGFRNTDGGAWEAGDFDFGGTTAALPATVRFRRDGARVRIDYNGENVYDESGADLQGGLMVGAAGAEGSDEWTVWRYPGDEEIRAVGIYGDTELSLQRQMTRDLAPPSQARVPDGWTVAAVYNESAGTEMDIGAGRSGYTQSGGVLTFRREAEGDLVRVELDRVGPDPPPPGLAFRIYEGQEGFSEIDEDGREPGAPPIATTNVNNNRANWHDTVNVANPWGVNVAPGDTIEGWRGVGFMPHGASASFRIDATGDPETDWQVIGGADILWNAYAGLLLLDGVALDLPESFCIEGTFARRYRAGHHNESYEELRKTAEGLDQFWADAGAVSGGGLAFNGLALKGWGPKSWSTRTLPAPDGRETFWPQNHAWGLRKGDIHQWWEPVTSSDPAEYSVGAMGYFGTPDVYRDLARRTDPPGNNVYSNTPDPAVPFHEVQSHNEIVEDEVQIQLEPFRTHPEVPNYVGAEWYTGLFPSLGLGPVGAMFTRWALCNVNALKFDPGKLLHRLPRNSHILEAYVPAKFVNLRGQVWQWEGGAGSDGSGYGRFWINGYEIYWHNVGEGWPEPPSGWEPDPEYDIQQHRLLPGAQVTFDAVGARFDSTRVYRLNNPAEAQYVLPSRRLISGPGGLTGFRSSLNGDGEWQMVNVTRAFRGMLSLTDSPVQELYWAPSIGNASTWSRVDTMSDFLQAQMMQATTNFHDQFPDYAYSGTAEGRYAEWDSFELGAALIRFRIGTTRKVYQLSIPADWAE